MTHRDYFDLMPMPVETEGDGLRDWMIDLRDFLVNAHCVCDILAADDKQLEEDGIKKDWVTREQIRELSDTAVLLLAGFTQKLEWIGEVHGLFNQMQLGLGTNEEHIAEARRLGDSDPFIRETAILNPDDQLSDSVATAPEDDGSLPF